MTHPDNGDAKAQSRFHKGQLAPRKRSTSEGSVSGCSDFQCQSPHCHGYFYGGKKVEEGALY